MDILERLDAGDVACILVSLEEQAKRFEALPSFREQAAQCRAVGARIEASALLYIGSNRDTTGART